MNLVFDGRWLVRGVEHGLTKGKGCWRQKWKVHVWLVGLRQHTQMKANPVVTSTFVRVGTDARCSCAAQGYVKIVTANSVASMRRYHIAEVELLINMYNAE